MKLTTGRLEKRSNNKTYVSSAWGRALIDLEHHFASAYAVKLIMVCANNELQMQVSLFDQCFTSASPDTASGAPFSWS